MIIQTLFDVGDVHICPNDRIAKDITGILVRNNKGKVMIAYQFDDELSWHMQEDLIGVDDGK